MTPPRLRSAAVSVAALLLSATLLMPPSVAAPPPASNATPSTVPSDAADNQIDRVLAISVDGLNPRAITRLGPSRTPAFHRMMREGAWTFNARSMWGQTRTLPNHTSMLTGRQLDLQEGGHGVEFNRDNGGTVHTAAGFRVASAFGVVHDNGGSTALYSAKNKFQFFARTWNGHGGLDLVGGNNGWQKIDTVLIRGNNNRLVQDFNSELRSRPRTFTFLHISLPDSAGHRYGFMSPRYLQAVRQTDRLLGTILSTVTGAPQLRQHMLVVLTADHGGNGEGHEDPSKLQNYRIPFMAWGRGVPANRNLYSINPTYRDPGRSRPGYQGRQPIRNGDIGNLVTDVLDLPPIPGSEFDRRQTLNLF